MPSKLPSLWSLVRLKPLMAGAALLLFGAGAFVYDQMRRAPEPVEWAPPIPLHAEATPADDSGTRQHDDSTEADASRPARTAVRIIRVEATPPPPPPVVTITSPDTGADFTSPATINYEVGIIPTAERASKVEYFLAQTVSMYDSICNDSRDVQIPNADLVKRGESSVWPYAFTDTLKENGSFALYAVITTKDDVRQISRPVVISVHEPYGEGGREIKGWGVRYAWKHPELSGKLPPELLRAAADEQSGGLVAVDDAGTPDFSVSDIKVEPVGMIYEGTKVTFTAVIKGGGKNLSYSWKVQGAKDFKGENSKSVTVDTRGLGGTRISAEVIVRDVDAGREVEDSADVGVFQRGGGNDYGEGDDQRPRLDNFAIELQNNPEAQGYIISYGGAASCREEAAAWTSYALKYLTSKRGIDSARILTVEGGFRDERSLELWVVPKGATPPAPSPTLTRPEESVPKCSPERLKTVGRFDDVPTAPPPNHPYTKCPEIAERLDFRTTLSSSYSEQQNFCPYNPKDPQTGETKVNLSAGVIGLYGRELNYRYKVNGGVIKGSGASVEWDLSQVMYSPGLYTAVLEVDDGCGCSTVSSASVLITNYCTPCFGVSYDCPTHEGASLVTLRAVVPDWATEKKLSFKWEVDKGRIVGGQGTPEVTVDTLGVEKGTRIAVSVEVGGIYSYCLNKITYGIVAGDWCRAGKIDEYGNVKWGGTIGLRKAKRRTQEEKVISVTTPEEGGQPTEQPSLTPAKGTEEKEYVKVAWPNPVEVQRSFSVVVTYDREKGTLEATDTEGKLVGRLETENGRLIKDRWGPDYEVWGAVKLKSAALGCELGCRDDFKPLAGAQQKWTFNLRTDQAGEQTFDLELWVEGRHVSNASRKDPEPVWSKEDLKLTVKDSPPTKKQVIASSVFLCFVGILFTARGIKFGGIKLLIAGGSIVEGDVVGGHKVGGDYVGGDKIGGDKTGGTGGDG